MDDEKSSNNDSKGIFTRDLPKPVVVGFVVILVLGIASNFIIRHYRSSSEQAETVRPSVPSPIDSTTAPPPREPQPLPQSPTAWCLTGKPTQLTEALATDPSLLSKSDRDGWTILHYCAAFARTDLVQTLIDHGADINALTYMGSTPLHLAIAVHPDASSVSPFDRSAVEAMMRLLLEHEADPNAHAPGSTAGSAAAWASYASLTDIVNVMAEYGGDATINQLQIPSTTISDGMPLQSLRTLASHGIGYVTGDKPNNRAQRWADQQTGYHSRLRNGGIAVFAVDEQYVIKDILLWDKPDDYNTDAAPQIVKSFEIEHIKGTSEDMWRKVMSPLESYTLGQSMR